MCETKERKNSKDYNYGVAILRIVFCYLVVSQHYYYASFSTVIPIYFRWLAVPIFVFISFYFGYNLIASGSIKKYIERGKRLEIPYLFWGIASYLVLWGLSLFTSIQKPSKQDLLYQVLFGSNEVINAPMWFQWEIIVITIIFILLYKVFKKKTSYVLLFVMVTAYVLQYLCISTTLLPSAPYEIRNDIVRFFDVIPIACAGYILSDMKLMDKIGKKTWQWLLFLLFGVLGILFPQLIPAPQIASIYSGIQYLVTTFFLFIAFYNMPLHKLPNVVKRIIKFVASYTMGIYCIHWTVGGLLNVEWAKLFNEERTAIEAFVIFVVSLAICVIIDKIPIKYAKMLVK